MPAGGRASGRRRLTLQAVALVYLAFVSAPSLVRFIGPSVNRAFAKVASLFLAAISVALIRAGIVGMIRAL